MRHVAAFTIAQALLLALGSCASAAAATPPHGHRHGNERQAMVTIPAGSYQALYATNGGRTRVARFAIDRALVTRADFLAFVTAHPTWRRSAVKPVFAERSYLADWTSDLDAGSSADLGRPMTNVSWFAAKAYCAAGGKRLPTTDEWELVASASETRRDAASDPAFLDRLVALYSAHPRAAGITNLYGVRAMHGPVWEWTNDFNDVVVSDDSRTAGSGVDARDHHLYCASAAIGARDLMNYPAFLRAAIRAGLTGRSTLDGLGFRCAADAAS